MKLTADQKRLAKADAMWRLLQERRPDGSRQWSCPQIARAVGMKCHKSALTLGQRHAALMAAEGVR